MSKKVAVIDWSRIVFDLEARGLTQREIAARCGFDARAADMNGKAWVNKLKNGIHSSPRFHEGALLLGLWAEVMGESAADAPRGDHGIRNDSKAVTEIPLESAASAVVGSGEDEHG